MIFQHTNTLISGSIHYGKNLKVYIFIISEESFYDFSDFCKTSS